MKYPLTTSQGVGALISAGSPAALFPSNSQRRAIFIFNQDTAEIVFIHSTLADGTNGFMFELAPLTGKHFFTLDYGTALQAQLFATTLGANVVVNGCDFSDVN